MSIVSPPNPNSAPEGPNENDMVLKQGFLIKKGAGQARSNWLLLEFEMEDLKLEVAMWRFDLVVISN